jgi:hypothetical protein
MIFPLNTWAFPILEIHDNSFPRMRPPFLSQSENPLDSFASIEGEICYAANPVAKRLKSSISIVISTLACSVVIDDCSLCSIGDVIVVLASEVEN